MLNEKLKLNKDVLSERVERKSMREGFGKALLDLGRENKNIVVLTADLKGSTKVNYFADEFPERFFQCGVAEQNMVTIASGLAASGKVPFAASYAVFSPGRNWEQIRTTICYNNVPVKLVGSHAGLLTGPDGATHQATEDMALMRVLPNMAVLVPCDYYEAYRVTLAAAKLNQPVYIRLARPDVPVVTSAETPFVIGQAAVFWESETPQVSIFACGDMTFYALRAAQKLLSDGIESEVINIASLKPLDERMILDHARVSGAIVTVEDHQIAGGMGSAVAELLAREYPLPIEFVGLKDTFGESGEPEELLDKYRLGIGDIVDAVRRVLKRK